MPTNISTFGFWLWVDNREQFVPFEDYPVFREATLAQILNFQRVGPDQFHWLGLDADLELDALEYPAAYPLQFKP